MKHGFTLVELSIVLVIIGLLVGGVLTGQSLIRAAELRSIVAEAEAYRTAVLSFKGKYFALPGDMDNAEAFWGTDPNGCPYGGGSTGACNGDGNGTVHTSMANRCENMEFWRHLSRADLIEGDYTTTTADCEASAQPFIAGVNAPAPKLDEIMMGIYYAGDIVSGTSFPGRDYFTANYGHIFLYGERRTDSPGVNHTPMSAALPVAEVLNMDLKIDDGQPDFGIMLTVRTTSRGNDECLTDTNPGTAEYNGGAPDGECAFMFKTGF